MPPVDHDCSLRDIVVAMINKIAKLEHELARLKKAHVGSQERAQLWTAIAPSRRPRPKALREIRIVGSVASRRVRAVGART